jgi:lysylphosphatidylglycerol synthetase-like protein (DUF2156 family)
MGASYFKVLRPASLYMIDDNGVTTLSLRGSAAWWPALALVMVALVLAPVRVWSMVRRDGCNGR